MDSAGSDRPQRRTALVGRELGRYDIQIAALSETPFADVGEIKEVGAGYTFFWSGHKSEERREAGVGFAIKTELVGKLSGLPKGINDRLMHTCDISRSRRVFPILGFPTRLSHDEPSRAQISRFQHLPIPIFRQCSIFNFAVINGTCY